MSKWPIMQRGKRGRSYPYIPIEFSSCAEAEKEFDDLLRPYSADSIWRSELFVQECVIVVPSRVA